MRPTFKQIHRDLYEVKSSLFGFPCGIVARGAPVRRRVNQWLAITRHGAVIGRFPRRKAAIEFLRASYTNYAPSTKGF